MNAEEILNQQDYEGDFWPGFVDILSGLILIFSFLLLVAGIIIAVIYQTFSTVKIPVESYQFILTTIQQSPLTIPSRHDVIEDIKRGKEEQILVKNTQQQLQIIGEQANQILNHYPVLKRKLVQEIRFLQDKIREVKASPPPEGETQKPRDFKGGYSDLSGADKIPSVKVNWGTSVDGEDVFISFNKADSSPPQGIVLDELRNTLKKWMDSRPGTLSVQVLVANAVTSYKALAQKESLKRALLVRGLLRSLNSKSVVKIVSIDNSLPNHRFGWLRLRHVRDTKGE